MFTIFGENVPMRSPDLSIILPGRIQRSFCEEPKDPAQVIHVDIVPLRKTLANSRAILLLENKGSKFVHLASATGDGSTPLAVDRGRANDGRLDRVRVLDAGVEDNLVHVTVEGGGWQIDQLVNAVEIVENFVVVFAECFLDFGVKISQNAGSTSVQPESRARGGMPLYEALGYGICTFSMV